MIQSARHIKRQFQEKFPSVRVTHTTIHNPYNKFQATREGCASFIQKATGNGNATETAIPLSEQMEFNVFVHTEETVTQLTSNAESAVAPFTTC